MMIVSFPFIIFTIKSIAFILHTLTHTIKQVLIMKQSLPHPPNILNIAVLIEQKKKKKDKSGFKLSIKKQK